MAKGKLQLKRTFAYGHPLHFLQTESLYKQNLTQGMLASLVLNPNKVLKKTQKCTLLVYKTSAAGGGNHQLVNASQNNRLF